MGKAVDSDAEVLGVSPTDRRAGRALFALLDLSKALSSEVDLDALLRVIVEKASNVVEAERTSIFIFDQARNRLWTRVAQGMAGTTIELPLGVGVAGDVAKTLKPVNIPDAYADSRFNSEFDRRSGFRTRSILAAPVLDAQGQLLGVIQSVNKTTAPAFSVEDESLMIALASHVAVAMERTRLTEFYVEKQRHEESLKVAFEIQMRMLPPATAETPADSPFALQAYIRPAKRVGGDLYDYFWTDDHLYFCIGDVSGKGVGAALIMSLAKTLLRANAALQSDPARVMESVNERLYEETDPTMFVTAFCGFMNLADGRLHFANAGHDRPLLRAPDGSIRPLDSKPGLALGVLPKFRYVAQEGRLEPGEMLFLYTDGITEAADASEQLFTADRLKATLQACSGSGPGRVVDAVVEAVDAFAHGAPQSDDLTMMCLQFFGSSAPRFLGSSGGKIAPAPEEPSSRAAEEPLVGGRFARSLESLPQIVALVERFFARSGLDASRRFPIDFALEEIFTNCVKHNAAGRGEVEIRLRRKGSDVFLTVIDPDSPGFDINNDAPPADTTGSLEERIPGGLGIHLVKKTMDAVEYSHEGRVASITLRKRMD
jgi:sigma-B regulation protein RsbU (phosphoserine phosphatase)